MLKKIIARYIAQAEKHASGLFELRGKVTMTRNTEDALRVDAATVPVASEQADAADEKFQQAEQLVALHLDAAYQYLVAVARIFRLLLGNKPSPLWAAAGWGDHSLRTPTTEDLILAHLLKLKVFLTEHPERQIADSQIQLTPARCEALYEALRISISGDTDPDHQQDANRIRGRAHYKSEAQKADQTLLLAEKALERRLRSFRAEFDDVVQDPLSPYYTTVGLPRPGETHAPGPVLNVRLTPLGQGQMQIEADPTPTADHYVFRLQVMGIDARPRYLGSNGQPNFLAKELPAGKTVSVIMAAVSEENQQGPASEPVQAVVT